MFETPHRYQTRRGRHSPAAKDGACLVAFSAQTGVCSVCNEPTLTCPDAQCAWLRLISDNLVRPSAYVISKAWTTSPSLTAVSPAFRGLTRKRPHSPDIEYIQAACSPISPSEKTRRLALYCDPVVINTKAEIAGNTSPHDIVSKGGTRVALRISVPAVEPIPDCSAHGGHPLLSIQRSGHAGIGKWEA